MVLCGRADFSETLCTLPEREGARDMAEPRASGPCCRKSKPGKPHLLTLALPTIAPTCRRLPARTRLAISCHSLPPRTAVWHASSLGFRGPIFQTCWSRYGIGAPRQSGRRTKSGISHKHGVVPLRRRDGGGLAPSPPEGFLGGISGGARFVVRVYSQSSPPLTKR